MVKSANIGASSRDRFSPSFDVFETVVQRRRMNLFINFFFAYSNIKLKWRGQIGGRGNVRPLRRGKSRIQIYRRSLDKTVLFYNFQWKNVMFCRMKDMKINSLFNVFSEEATYIVCVLSLSYKRTKPRCIFRM